MDKNRMNIKIYKIIILSVLIGCNVDQRGNKMNHFSYFQKKANNINTWPKNQLSDFEGEYQFITNNERNMSVNDFQGDLKRNIHFWDYNSNSLTYTIIQPEFLCFNQLKLFEFTQFKYISTNNPSKYQWNPVFNHKDKIIMAIRLISDFIKIPEKELLENNVFVFSLINQSLYVYTIGFSFFENPMPSPSPFIKIDLDSKKIVYNVIVG